jgi:hypothetical protein
MAFLLGCCYASFMQIVVEIPDEFAAQVEARGLNPESYVRSLIDDVVRTAPMAPANGVRKKDMEAFFRGMAANSDKIPQLPDEAFTRESFYQDHD